jgi:PRTRC genetic system protein B
MEISSLNNLAFVPFKALIFYKKEQNYDLKYYTEIADIEHQEITTKRPLSESEYLNLVRIIDSKEKKKRAKEQALFSFNSYIKRNIISFKVIKNRLEVCWTIPAHKNNFLFKQQVGKLNYPNLLFKVKHQSLMVYAYKGTINDKTILYKAPFPNIYDGGGMCFGNINVRDLIVKDVSKLILNFEDSFFNSGFNALESANRTKSNTFELLKRLMASGDKFPTNELVKTNKRVYDVISK